MEEADGPAEKPKKAGESSTPQISLPEEFSNSVGKVIRITLINFLNHANLVVNCSANLNMIFGLNGQGKSAIVQGLALCFGGYGHSVGRDASLKQYIKDYHLRDGPPYAKIEVLMSNDGEGGYNQEEFGNIITLSRVIKKSMQHSGSSVFTLGGTKGRGKHASKKELHRYLRHIRLNIGNPTTYMDQESCKSFFFQSNPAHIYRYYAAAAGLVEMEENINTEKKNLEDCKAELKLRKSVLAPDREKLNDLAKQIRLFEEKLHEWKSAKEMYKLSLYKADKDKYDSLKEAQETHSLSNPKEEIRKLKESIRLYTSEHDEMKAEIDKHSGSTLKLKESITSIVDKISTLDESINDTKSKISAKKASISHIETAMDKLKEEWEASAAEPPEADKERMEQELEKCHKEYAKIDSEHQNETSVISHIESTISEIEMQLKDAKADLEEQKSENSVMSSEGTSPRKKAAMRRDTLYRYDVEAVRKEISRKKSDDLFFHNPIGPIGDYLFVTRDVPSWRVLGVVEYHLRHMLSTWLVATERDRKELEAILLRHECGKNHIKIMKTNAFSREDITARTQKLTEKKGKSSIYDYFSTVEMPPILLYVLEGSCGISRAFVCNDDYELNKVLTDDSLDVGVAYSLTNMNSGRKINGSIHIMPCYEKHPFAYEHVRLANYHSGDYSSELKERQDSGKEREKSLLAMIDSLNSELEECNKALAEHRNKLSNIVKDKTSIIRKRTRLEADLKEEIDTLITTEESVSRRNYRESMERIQSDYKKQLKELSKELLELEKEVESLESQKKALEGDQLGTNDELKAVIKEVSSRRVEMQKIQQRIQSQKSQIKNLEKNIRDHQQKQIDYEKELETLEKKVKVHQEELVTEGIDFTGELPTKPPETYLKILNLSKDVLQRIVNDSRNIESHLDTLREKHAAAECALEEKERRLRETTENYQTQKKNYMKRCQRFEDCRTRIEKKAKKTFRQTLDAVTGYDGNLIFNDVAKTLDIQVHNKQQSYSRVHVATDLKTLSGGEQSSIQLSMLQSLASMSYSPVHMFDEVDVYMDESVRVKNIEALVEFAAKNRNRQFFLVTPHSELAKHIKDLYPDITRIFNVARDG
ncbi:hypothetical protein BgAZ_500510 [Babesia gibsoni]|uniref:Rad50/SbcC-type AAA domain-containing protein n=1 Tax=Babesia gibsoni TaxID=33632 RepID=A0AAD8LGE7_BABGI|nr:hypothetical protein BgAZ_500510 [Babesia gibsoni]